MRYPAPRLCFVLEQPLGYVVADETTNAGHEPGHRKSAPFVADFRSRAPSWHRGRVDDRVSGSREGDVPAGRSPSEQAEAVFNNLVAGPVPTAPPGAGPPPGPSSTLGTEPADDGLSAVIARLGTIEQGLTDACRQLTGGELSARLLLIASDVAASSRSLELMRQRRDVAAAPVTGLSLASAELAGAFQSLRNDVGEVAASVERLRADIARASVPSASAVQPPPAV